MDGGAPPAIAPDAVINLELGDPTMYEAFWREVGERSAVVIPGWSGMSYFSNAQSLCWYLDPEFEREVRLVHRLVGNTAVDDGYHLVVGTGATQLFQAAMYALSPPGAERPVGVVSPAPYYSSYPPQTDLLLSGLYQWAGDAKAFDGHGHIEPVCSPNNPDGAIRDAVLSSEYGKAIHDLVYYWPQYTPITGAAAHDVMLFTMSKVTGHAGARLGGGRSSRTATWPRRWSTSWTRAPSARPRTRSSAPPRSSPLSPTPTAPARTTRGSASSTSRGDAWGSAGGPCAPPWRPPAPSASRRRPPATATSPSKPWQVTPHSRGCAARRMAWRTAPSSCAATASWRGAGSSSGETPGASGSTCWTGTVCWTCSFSASPP
uniref:Alliinase C-terminal domain-containing protein n=1 Tax=Aegilops tauschii subsp. strangulata TaxID=200361 RepID=A0A452Y485_AEGTS